MWRMLFKKFGMSFVVAFVFLLGILGYALVIAPFNITYLLKIPAALETNFAWGFAALFACVVTVIVRTDWCYHSDFLLPKEGEKWHHRILRAATSQELLADLIVCAFWWLVFYGIVVIREDVNWIKVAWKLPLLVVGDTLMFGLVDTLLYVIARKRADRRLKRRKE